MEKDIKIRAIAPTDAAACGPVMHAAFKGISDRHNFPPDFPSVEMAAGLLHFFAAHRNIFGVVAEHDGRVVGSNFLDERDAIRAVGPITVEPGFQGHGAGRKLMEAAVERGRAAAGVRLVQDAFNTVSMALYASLGFEIKEPLAMLKGTPTAKPSGQSQSRPMQAADINPCASLCRKIHGLDRSGELQDALKMFKPVILIREGRIVAYASAPDLWALNHGVAETEADMTDLILAGAAINGGSISFLLPIRQASLFRWCLAAGLRIVKPMNLMAMGQYHEPNGFYYPSVGY